MAAAYMRSSPNPVRRKSPASPAQHLEKFFYALRILEKFFRLVPSTKPKERLNRNRIAPNSSRNGAGLNGGGRRRPLRTRRALKKAGNRGWNFSCAAETPKIRAKNGPSGTARTARPRLPSKRRQRALCNGKRSFTTGARGMASIG